MASLKEIKNRINSIQSTQKITAAMKMVASAKLHQREVKNVAIVVCSSNTGLCGSFNANVWKSLEELIQSYKAQQVHIEFYPVGKKIAKELQKAGYDYHDEFISIADNLEYEKVAKLAAR